MNYKIIENFLSNIYQLGFEYKIIVIIVLIVIILIYYKYHGYVAFENGKAHNLCFKIFYSEKSEKETKPRFFLI